VPDGPVMLKQAPQSAKSKLVLGQGNAISAPPASAALKPQEAV